MTYASICTGIRGFDLAFDRAGMTNLWTCEIDRQCREVNKYHNPKGIYYEDMLKLDKPARPDVLCGGTPCQSFSVAGLRKGMADPRGNLALVFLGLIDRLRPEWVVWENVPGIHSSWSDVESHPPGEASREIIDEIRRLGEILTIDQLATLGLEEVEEVAQSNDFDCFIAGLEELGYGVATTILDAQFFGLAQRRERVFVVAHIGGDWRRAAAVLFDASCLRGDSAPSREAGKGVTGTLGARTTAGGGFSTDFACSGGVVPINMQAAAKNGKKSPNMLGIGDAGDPAFTVNASDQHAVAFRTAGNCGPFEQGDKTGALNTATDPSQNIILEPIPLDLRNGNRNPDKHDEMNRQGCGIGEEGDVSGTVSSSFAPGVAQPIANTLQKHHGNPQLDQTLVPIAFQPGNLSRRAGAEPSIDTFPTLGAATLGAATLGAATLGAATLGAATLGDQAPCVAFAQNTRDEVRQINGDGAIAGALPNQPGMKQQTYLQQNMAVRRLTPKECERLQGFPDDWTKFAVNEDGEVYEQADGPRYRQLGNAVAVPCVEWIANRIKMVAALTE